MDLKFDFSFETKKTNSFREQALIGSYDLEDKKIIQEFKGNYALPEQYNIGLIVGNSGSGKTSIFKHCFGEFEKLNWNENSIIDNFNENLTVDQITFLLGSCGFNSVPYWLKPFHVLSNGEKTRVEIARLISEKEFFGYDEFTSLVDRDVAKSMANSIQKAIRKFNKKAVFVTCHKDIVEWLQPDWVYDTDECRFFFIQNPEQNNSNLKYINAIEKNGIFLKSIII